MTANTQFNWATFHDEPAARHFIERHFFDALETGRLRAALADNAYGLMRWTDAAVLAAASSLLTRGAWGAAWVDRPALPVDAGATAARPQRRPEPAALPASARSPDLFRDMDPMPSARKPAPAPAPPPPPAPASVPAPPDWSPSSEDQIAQADVLTAAARDGTPFCAVCERMRQAKLAAQDE